MGVFTAMAHEAKRRRVGDHPMDEDDDGAGVYVRTVDILEKLPKGLLSYDEDVNNTRAPTRAEAYGRVLHPVYLYVLF